MAGQSSQQPQQSRPGLPQDLHLAITHFLAQQQQLLQASAPAPEAERQQDHVANAQEASGSGALGPSAGRVLVQAGSAGAAMLRKLAPFGLQMAISAAAYSTGLGLFQLLGYGLRVSCNTRVVSSCLGCLGVGVSSALAGHMSRHVQKQIEQGGPMALLRTPPWEGFDQDEALADALLGIALFKAWKGQFRNLMPSHLGQPGAWAQCSLPILGGPGASGEQYATGERRKQLQFFLNKHGCHHCGRRGGLVIGDHIPPTKSFTELQMALKARNAQRASHGPLQQALDKVWSYVQRDDVPRTLRQRFYPQCRACCQKQACALRHDKNMLLVHWRLWHLAAPGVLPGLLVALRPPSGPHVPPPDPAKPSGARGKARSGTRVAAPGKQPLALPDGSKQGGAWWHLGLGTGVGTSDSDMVLPRPPSTSSIVACDVMELPHIHLRVSSHTSVPHLQQSQHPRGGDPCCRGPGALPGTAGQAGMAPAPCVAWDAAADTPRAAHYVHYAPQGAAVHHLHGEGLAVEEPPQGGSGALLWSWARRLEDGEGGEGEALDDGACLVQVQAMSPPAHHHSHALHHHTGSTVSPALTLAPPQPLAHMPQHRSAHSTASSTTWVLPAAVQHADPAATITASQQSLWGDEPAGSPAIPAAAATSLSPWSPGVYDALVLAARWRHPSGHHHHAHMASVALSSASVIASPLARPSTDAPLPEPPPPPADAPNTHSTHGAARQWWAAVAGEPASPPASASEQAPPHAWGGSAASSGTWRPVAGASGGGGGTGAGKRQHADTPPPPLRWPAPPPHDTSPPAWRPYTAGPGGGAPGPLQRALSLRQAAQQQQQLETQLGAAAAAPPPVLGVGKRCRIESTSGPGAPPPYVYNPYQQQPPPPSLASPAHQHLAPHVRYSPPPPLPPEQQLRRVGPVTGLVGKWEAHAQQLQQQQPKACGGDASQGVGLVSRPPWWSTTSASGMAGSMSSLAGMDDGTTGSPWPPQQHQQPRYQQQMLPGPGMPAAPPPPLLPPGKGPVGGPAAARDSPLASARHAAWLAAGAGVRAMPVASTFVLPAAAAASCAPRYGADGSGGSSTASSSGGGADAVPHGHASFRQDQAPSPHAVSSVPATCAAAAAPSRLDAVLRSAVAVAAGVSGGGVAPVIVESLPVSWPLALHAA